MDIQVAKYFAAALAIIPLFGVAIALGQIYSALLNASARNPSVRKDLFPMAILGSALAEAVALFALLIAFLILFS